MLALELVTSNLMQPNVLMCRYVCALLPPTRQAHLRSAGSVGYDAFEELVALGDVPAYVEVVAEGGDARLGALMNAPIRGVKKPKRPRKKIPEEYVIVFWEAAMRRRGIAEPSWAHLPWKSVRYHFVPNATHPPHHYNYFMRSSKATHIEVRGLEYMEQTPHGFLYQCQHLKHANFSCFENVRVLGDSFINYSFCEVEEEAGEKIRGLDLTPFIHVTSILSCVLVSLNFSTIDLSPLRNVVSIGSHFLANSPKLKSVDLSPFTLTETIDSCFMSGCSGLTSIDLSPLVGLNSIKGSFLSGCAGLTHIDLTPLKGVRSAGVSLLFGCSGLRSVKLPTFDSPDAVGAQFLSQCSGLQEIDLSPLHSMTTIPPYFLNGCAALTSVDLTPFSGVTEMSRVGLGAGWIAPEGSFLLGCTGIVHLDMSPMVLLSKKQKQEAVADSFDGRITWGCPL